MINHLNNYCDSADLSTCSNSVVTEADSVGKANHYHVGNLYSFAAAVAINDTSSYKTRFSIMPDSICPAGWKLPNSLLSYSEPGMQSQLLSNSGIIASYTATGSYPAQWKTGGKTKITSDPFFLIYSGHIVDGRAKNVGSYGSYWSSTLHSDANNTQNSDAYGLVFTGTGNMFPQYDDSRGNGYSIRCVARD